MEYLAHSFSLAIARIAAYHLHESVHAHSLNLDSVLRCHIKIGKKIDEEGPVGGRRGLGNWLSKACLRLRQREQSVCVHKCMCRERQTDKEVRLTCRLCDTLGKIGSIHLQLKGKGWP